MKRQKIFKPFFPRDATGGNKVANVRLCSFTYSKTTIPHFCHLQPSDGDFCAKVETGTKGGECAALHFLLIENHKAAFLPPPLKCIKTETGAKGGESAGLLFYL